MGSWRGKVGEEGGGLGPAGGILGLGGGLGLGGDILGLGGSLGAWR